MKSSELFRLMYLILSTMIGAGILALPYAVYSVGVISSIVLFLFSSILVYTASVILLKASLESYHLSFSAIFEKYLGKKSGKISTLLSFLSILFVCIIYLNIINFSLQHFSKTSETFTLFISAISMIVIYLGLNIVEKSENFLFLLKICFLLLFLLFIIRIPSRYELKLFNFDLKNLFSFILISVFSLSFYSIIPYLPYLVRDEKTLESSIKFSIILGFLLYLIFSFFVSTRSGEREISTLGFIEIFNLLTIFFVLTPYISLSWTLSDIISDKLKVEKNKSVLISFLLQFLLFIFLPKGFILYLEFVSAIFILAIYALLGLIGLKFYKKFRFSKYLSLFLFIFSLLLFLFKFFDLILP